MRRARVVEEGERGRRKAWVVAAASRLSNKHRAALLGVSEVDMVVVGCACVCVGVYWSVVNIEHVCGMNQNYW